MPKIIAVPLEDAEMDFSPTIRTVQLITYMRQTGRGVEGDPMRFVKEAYTTDGRLVYSVDYWPPDNSQQEQRSETRSQASAE